MLGAVGIVAAVTVAPTPQPAVAAPGIAGMIVFLDPGHNGANDASISRQVPTGRGGTKDCQASGTTTNDGYPEHTFTWDTTLRIRAALNALGARTAMSRGDDSTVGPCVDQRAAMANALHPNAIVSRSDKTLRIRIIPHPHDQNRQVVVQTVAGTRRNVLCQPVG